MEQDSEPEVVKQGKTNGEVRSLLFRHVFRVACLAVTFLIVGFVMAIVQVVVDNEALRYFFDVTEPDHWVAFQYSMHLIQEDPKLSEKFPAILISKKYGGEGDHGKLPQEYYPGGYPTPSNRTSYPMIANDVVFQTTLAKDPTLFRASDIICKGFILLTIIYIIVMPYFILLRKKSRDKKTKLRIFLLSSIKSLTIFRRILCVAILVYGVRASLLRLMILPSETHVCTPILRRSFGEKLVGALRVVGGLEITCYDFIFSGHTAVVTIMTWFWAIYTQYFLFPVKRKDNRVTRYLVLWLIRLFAISFLVLEILLLLYSRSHYTLDIVLGFLMGTFLFWLWHFMISLYSCIELHPEGKIKPKQIVVPIVSMNWLMRITRLIDGGDLEGCREGDEDLLEALVPEP